MNLFTARDVRKILKKYMELVVICEGVSFVSDADSNPDLTERDIIILREIELEIKEER